ncbi:aminopeptidase N-like [Bicyclus anynana]|uniref:Aminopeptidase N-like n=1 Tax=Bicyclus anynana TaxID=110368 RepID=A0ABM3LNZ5_BICAN|nr:aminopeptidase N-like [Bicyclus anynana]
MARLKTKCVIILYTLIVSVSARSLPLKHESTSINEGAYIPFKTEVLEDALDFDSREEIEIKDLSIPNGTHRIETRDDITTSNIRNGQTVFAYNIQLTKGEDNNNIEGKAILDVRVSEDTRANPLRFHILGIKVESVLIGLVTDDSMLTVTPNIINNILEIKPPSEAYKYILHIEYNIPIRNDGVGLYAYDEEYIAMNLHPTNARRVFPCMDEPNLRSVAVTFNFIDMGFEHLMTNTALAGDSETTFQPLQGPVHRWAMVAHSMNNIVNPVPNLVSLYVRRGILNQDQYGSVAISSYYVALNTWTGLDHSQIIEHQDGGLHVMAVPDVHRDWYGLSTLCIWEPFILMENNNNAVKQRKLALVTIAEGMARQWFGWILYPDNWRDQWVIAGLASYAGYEVAKNFQTPPPEQEDPSLIDMNAMFTLDVIQESLLYDAYVDADPLRLANAIFNPDQIRLHIDGLIKTKAPALLRMTRLLLSRQTDLVQNAAQGLLRSRSVNKNYYQSNSASTPVTTRNLYDSLNAGYKTPVGSGLIDNVEDFLRPWVENSGYPYLTVNLLGNTGVTITQHRFGFSNRDSVAYAVPLTFTTGNNPNFEDLFPTRVEQNNAMINDVIFDDCWIIFNLQGQGYYRVNYDDELWNRLIEALGDEETRDDIHPLNRASLLDDAFNLARAGILGYDVPFEMVLTMELETEYAVWKAYIRNMEFIRKRLMPFVDDDDDLNENIYWRLLRRAIVAVEEEIGWEPDGEDTAMMSLTRGLVMEHACKIGYETCVAAAVDIFFNPNDEEEVNPNIPPELRPAVYCTMLREDEDDVALPALQALLNRNPPLTRYERLVVLESFACSENNGFITDLLQETINDESPYVVEERSRIFAAIASSSIDNARAALHFLTRNAQAIRNTYGGPEKLEDAIFVMAENVANGGLRNEFNNWITSLDSISNLGDSATVARRALARIDENMQWNNNNLGDIYVWIDENDAPTIFVSTFLMCISVFIALINYN